MLKMKQMIFLFILITSSISTISYTHSNHQEKNSSTKKETGPAKKSSSVNLDQKTLQSEKNISNEKVTEEIQSIAPDIKRKFFEEQLDAIRHQIEKLIFCCQQLEQVLQGEKIKLHKTKQEKKEIQAHIAAIKMTLQNLLSNVLTQPSIEVIAQGALLSQATTDYILSCVTNNISTISFPDFQDFITKQFEDPNITQDLPDLIASNNEKVTKLVRATDTVGLTTFNKIFRYMYETPLPVVGRPLLSCIKDTTVITTSAALLYAIAMYCLPGDLAIPGTSCTINDLPGSKFIGHRITSTDVDIAGFAGRPSDPTMPGDISKTVASEPSAPMPQMAGYQLGVGNTVERGIRNFGGTIFPPFTVGATMYLLKNFESSYKALRIKSKKMLQKFVSYCKGDVDKSSTAAFDTYTKDVYFSDIIGGKHLEKLAKELAHYLKHPERYERTKIYPSTGYLLVGPPQTGKSYFARALRTLINQTFEGNEQHCKFLPVTRELLKQYTVERVFEIARFHAPCILFIDEIDLTGASRSKDPDTTSQLLTCMSGLESDTDSKKVIVIAATNRPEELDFALLKDGRFGTVINFEYPCYEHRKSYLQKALKKRNIMLADEYIDAIAQETEGSCYNTLDKLISTALLQAMSETRSINKQDFENSLDRQVRNITPELSMSEEEKDIVATYQAGQAIARHILDPKQEIVKVTIYPVAKPINVKEGIVLIQDQAQHKSENAEHIKRERVKPTRTGGVFTKSTRFSKEFVSDQEHENECLILLAGQAALELIKGKPFNNLCKDDRALAMNLIEQTITQGTEATTDTTKEILAKKNELYNKVKSMLQAKLKNITLVKNYLLEHAMISRETWQELAKEFV